MSVFKKGVSNSVGGTCIGALFYPLEKDGETSFEAVEKELSQFAGLIICVTKPSMVELRKTFDEIGFTSFEVDNGFFHHTIDASTFVSKEDKEIYELFLEGHRKSIEEGRTEDELRGGDYAWYNGGNWRFEPESPTKFASSTPQKNRWVQIDKVNNNGVRGYIDSTGRTVNSTWELPKHFFVRVLPPRTNEEKVV